MAGLAIPEALRQAISHQRAGRLAPAEALCRDVLAADPTCVEALRLLGAIARQAGRADLAPAIHYNLGVALHAHGKCNEAVASFRRAIALQPAFAEAHSNLGKLLKDRGQIDEALACLRRAVALKPGFALAHNNLGTTLLAAGRFAEALVAFQRAVALEPGLAEAHHNMGVFFRGRGLQAEALDSFRRAAELQPDSAEAHQDLAQSLADLGRIDDAIACLQRAVAIKPDRATFHHSLGNLFHAAGRLDEAIASYRRMLALESDSVDALSNLGVVLHERGFSDEAAACLQRALALQPSLAVAHNNLGRIFRDRGQFASAVACFQQALALQPALAATHNNLGLVFQDLGRLDDALACLSRARDLQPDLIGTHNNLGGVFKDRGQLDEAIACYRRALALDPRRADIHSNLVLSLHYSSGPNAPAIDSELQAWQERHARPLAVFIRPHGNDRSSERPLRVGYVSADFKLHSVAFFLLPLLQAHERGQIQAIGYSSTPRPDAMTARFQACTEEWCDLTGVSDEAAARRIRADRIDLLVDLSGHTAGNRLLVFARKPAPVQVSYLGFPGATGLATIDYRLTDPWADPPGATGPDGPEQLVRLPETAWCYAPLPGSPPVSEPPAARHGRVTFGCFNNLAKVSDEMLVLWTRILQQVPRSRLMMKHVSLGSPSVASRLRTFFAQHGCTADRLELLPHQASQFDHLRCYGEVDLALDTFPYHGTTTTCEALWMGVPVVTLAGHCHISRVGVSLLTNAGLPDFIAETPEAYVAKAVAAAEDLSGLAPLRAGLRERMGRSPLMDAPRIARAVEAAYRTMWRRWCDQPASAPPR